MPSCSCNSSTCRHAWRFAGAHVFDNWTLQVPTGFRVRAATAHHTLTDPVIGIQALAAQMRSVGHGNWRWGCCAHGRQCCRPLHHIDHAGRCTTLWGSLYREHRRRPGTEGREVPTAAQMAVPETFPCGFLTLSPSFEVVEPAPQAVQRAVPWPVFQNSGLFWIPFS